MIDNVLEWLKNGQTQMCPYMKEIKNLLLYLKYL